MKSSSASQSGIVKQFLNYSSRLIPKDSVVPVLQGELQGYRWITGSTTHRCWLGTYELDKQKEISKLVRPSGIAFDIGANVGFYTLLFSRLLGADGKVFAFEPLPENIEYLKRHLALNKISNVEVLEVAVSQTSGTALFQLGSYRSMGKLAESGDFEVKKVAIDDLMEQGKLPAPDYLKIDIEGEELNALHGAERTIRAHHPIIFLATHSEDLYSTCSDFLSGLDYDLQLLDADHGPNTREITAIQRTSRQ